MIRKPYEPRERYAIEFTEPSLAKQSMAAECDINVIMARYQRTGVVPQIIGGAYEDVSHVTSYHDAWNIILEAQDMFMRLPAQVRKAFDNDPAKLLAAIEDPESHAMLRELGIMSEDPVGGETLSGSPSAGSDKGPEGPASASPGE